MNKIKFLSDKKIALGICGVSTAYESAYLAKQLEETGADLEVLISEQGSKFIAPLTFEEITGSKVIIEAASEGEQAKLENTLARTDMVIIAPASFNFIGRLSSNLEGGLLNKLSVESDQPVFIVPSLDKKLYSSQNVTKNLQDLRDRGYHILEPSRGEKPEPHETELPLFPKMEEIIEEIGRIFQEDSLLKNKKVLVTASPTRRSFDSTEPPATRSRISLGFQISQQAREMGGEVLLVSGPTEQIPPSGVGVVWTRTTEELDDLLLEESSEQDLIIMAGSARDWETMGGIGLPKGEKTQRLNLDLDERPDVLRKLGKLKEDEQILVSVELNPSAGDKIPEEKIEGNNLDAYFFRQGGKGPGELNSDLFSGKMMFTDGSTKEFKTQNDSRLARSLLKEIGRNLVEKEV